MFMSQNENARDADHIHGFSEPHTLSFRAPREKLPSQPEEKRTPEPRILEGLEAPKAKKQRATQHHDSVSVRPWWCQKHADQEVADSI
jgi:hypothetical protein